MGEIAQRIEELKQCALECRICDLSKTRKNVVFGEGNPETPLVIIGEGPGQNEDATGRPFVGRAGALLDQALLENNITRKHVYIMNVVKCRACIIENGHTRNRPPSPGEITACSMWLKKQLEIIKPLVILCLGAPSAKSIIRSDFKMTQERGQFFTSEYAPHAIAALHPAYVLRQIGQTNQVTRQQLVDDIGAARRKVVELKKASKPAVEEPSAQPQQCALEDL